MSSGRLKVLSSFASRQGLLLKKFTFSVWLPVTLISSFHCGKLTDTLMRSNNYKSFHSKSKKESVNLKGSSIEGTVQQVLFESRETQYSVLEVLVHRSSCKELEGETIQGNLTESERYGRQFRVKEKRLRKKGLTDRLKDSDLRGYCGKDTETIEIRVERILFTSGNSSQYAVMQCVTTESLEDVFTVVSYFGPLTPGSSVSICGKWVHHDKYGLQFHAKSCLEEQNLQSLKTEKDEWLLETIQSYLSSHTVPGIGPVLAKRLCSYFGTRIEDVLEQGDMENLLQVRGLRQKSARALIDHFQEKGILRRATLGLMKLGFPLSLVSRILSSYGIQRSLFLVENDPYVFVEDLKGVGFKKIDRIARSMSPKFAVSRYRAAIKLALRAAVKEGHCFLYLSECDSISKQYETELSLSYQVKKLITDDFEDAQFDKSLFVEALEALETSNAIVLHSTSHETCVYLKKMYDYEFQLGALLKRYRAGSGHSLPDSLHLAQEDTRLCIITGGPGSGKTYTARRIVELWKTKYGSNNIALTAPTGRAAARLAECTGLTAQTIHRLLEYQPRGERGGVFKRNKRRPLDVDAVLVDEFSMVDIEMAFSLLNALKPDTKLVLIGDMFQLPSVGPGQVLKDICMSNQFCIIHLTSNFRQQKQRSSLIETASQIRLGTVPYLTTFSASHIWDMYQSNSLSTFFSQLQTDLIMIEEKDPSGAVALLHPLLDKDVWTQNNVSPYHDIQIISPGTKGSVGTIQLNLSLKQQLNPPDLNHEGHSFVVGNTSLTLHLGDKVFQKVNDYNRDVFNGDIGVVEGFEKKYSRTSQVVVHVRFMDRIVSYSSEDVVFNLSHAYALTVHKSQGSEFPVVFVVLFPMHYTLFNRSLLYTAVTRAKKLCVVIGTKRTLAICVKQSKESQRNSMLPHFF
ncbi:ATP-dependent RecD-like DNA helicase [Galdieria sulphuraria]|nr:ATP-dependent RecD-like DNA helicase [Galdieria sulphuraria]